MTEDLTKIDSPKESSGEDSSNLVAKSSKELEKCSNYSLMGEVIDDKYIVIDAIGEGRTSIVYLGQSMDTRESVAIKTLKFKNPELIETVFKGARTFKEIEHPNLVKILDVIEHTNGQPVVVMKYVEGISITQLLETMGKIDDENTLVSIVSGVCSAIEYIHTKSTFHGALSPNQILVSENEVADDLTVTLTDCGISFTGLDCCASLDNELSYSSPEQRKSEYVGVNTDIYSLGVITYKLLTGKHPFARKKLSSLVAGKSEDEPTFIPLTHHGLDLPCLTKLNQLLEQSLEKDPDWRMPSISQFKKELLDWRDEAVLDDYDEADDDFDIDDEFDKAFEDESVKQPAAENILAKQAIEAPKEEEPKTNLDEDKIKTESQKEEDALRENVNFQATPSFYNELYTEGLKEKTPEPAKEVVKEPESKEVESKDEISSPSVKDVLGDNSGIASITEEEVARASKDKRRRRRKTTRSTQQNVRTTIRNLVKLRENQGSQEETMTMQFVEKLSSKGPRQSPKKTAIKLVVGCSVTAILTGLVMLNIESLQSAFFSGSQWFGEITKEKKPEEKIAKTPDIEDEVKVENKSLKSLKAIKKSLEKVNPNAPLESSSSKRLKLKPLEKQTPLASEYYKNWRHHRHQLPSSKVGKRRRIDYKEFNQDWLK